MTESHTILTPHHREVTLTQDVEGRYYLEVVNSLFRERITALLSEDKLTELRDALNTILDPQLYYLRLVEGDPHSFINLVTSDSHIRLDDKREWCGHQTRFTVEEIESNPALKKFEAFKVPVEEVDG